MIDLGARWTEWTGLPFVFALWLIAPDADVDRVAARLHRAGEVARTIPSRPDEARVHYELGAREMEGLERFWREAVTRDLAAADCRPRFLAAPPSV